jgi:hypothetical protein
MHRTLVAVLLVITLTASAGAGAEEKSPYPLYPQFYAQIRHAIAEGKPAGEIVEAIDKVLDEAVTLPVRKGPATTKPANPITAANQARHLEQLLCLRNAAVTFAKASDREMAVYLLDRPQFCSRFLHALHEWDNLNGAMKVLAQLKDLDAKRFDKWSEFCIAYSVVWDDFHGHQWVPSKIEDGTMLANYKHYVSHEKQLLINPSQLPFELGIYVVGTRLSAGERDWIDQNYTNVRFDPGTLYRTVPWTKKLSPAHGTGEGIDYTLANIRKYGGVCMEQAYYAENILRTYGLPATYTAGRGGRGGHAWVGALMLTPRPHWDFTFGRYEYDHYYKGEVQNPTCERLATPDSVVAMTAALLQAGSIDKIEEGYYYCDAALWVLSNYPSDTEEGKKKVADLSRGLLEKSLKASPYNTKTWLFLSELAGKGLMDQKTAQFWAGKLFDLTVNDFPDFCIDCMERFLECMKDPREKAGIYAKMYQIIGKARPDLAADIKVKEGDIWLEQKDVNKALESYLYPLVNFSKDQHVLEAAQERVEQLNGKADDTDLEKAYVQVLKSIGAMKQTSEEIGKIRKTIAGNLAALYRKRGDETKAKQAENLM